jgi:hypothetical protein
MLCPYQLDYLVIKKNNNNHLKSLFTIPQTKVKYGQMMDQHTLDFLSSHYHGFLVVDFYQQIQYLLTPLLELILSYECN